MNRSSTTSEISFHRLLGKANVLVSENSIVVIITVIKQPSAERYLANTFTPVLLRTCSASKKISNTSFTENLWMTKLFRSSHWRCSVKKGVLENFAKLTGKHLWFAKFSGTPFLQNSSRRLLLAFLCNFTKMGCCQQCLENLR